MSSQPNPPSSDSGLFERARAGDHGALEELLDSVQDRLEAVARAGLGARLREKVHASDILQSTYVQVLKSIPGFRGASEEEFAEWVVRILQRTIRNRARYFRAGRRDQGREGARDADTVPDQAPDPSGMASLSEELILIGRAMSTLSKDYRRILTLHLDPHQTHQRTAEIMGRSEGASRVLLARARAALLIAMDRERRGADGDERSERPDA